MASRHSTPDAMDVERRVVPIRPEIKAFKTNRPEDRAAIEHRLLVAAIGRQRLPDATDRLDDVLQELGRLPCHKLRCVTTPDLPADEAVLRMCHLARVAVAEFNLVEAQFTLALNDRFLYDDEHSWQRRRNFAAERKNGAVEDCMRTPATKHWHNRQLKMNLIKAAAPFGKADEWRLIVAADEVRLAEVRAQRGKITKFA